jgi:hypothetical protein
VTNNEICLKVAHASELPLIFGPVPTVASIETGFSIQLRDFWINFVNNLNPGGALLTQ